MTFAFGRAARWGANVKSTPLATARPLWYFQAVRRFALRPRRMIDPSDHGKDDFSNVPRVSSSWQRRCIAGGRSDRGGCLPAWLDCVQSRARSARRADVLPERIRHAPFRLPCAALVMAGGAKAAAPPALRSSCRAQSARSVVLADLVSGAEPCRRNAAVRAPVWRGGLGLCPVRDDACDPAL